MSIHHSLKSRKIKQRSVLKRHERLLKAIRENKWRTGQSVFGLPKFNRSRFKLGPKKEEEKTKTTLGGRDLIQEHLAIKDLATKKKKKDKKETTGR